MEVSEECTLKAKVMGYKHWVLVNKVVSHGGPAKSDNNSETNIHETTYWRIETEPLTSR